MNFRGWLFSMVLLASCKSTSIKEDSSITAKPKIPDIKIAQQYGSDFSTFTLHEQFPQGSVLKIKICKEDGSCEEALTPFSELPMNWLNEGTYSISYQVCIRQADQQLQCGPTSDAKKITIGSMDEKTHTYFASTKKLNDQASALGLDIWQRFKSYKQELEVCQNKTAKVGRDALANYIENLEVLEKIGPDLIGADFILSTDPDNNPLSTLASPEQEATLSLTTGAEGAVKTLVPVYVFRIKMPPQNLMHRVLRKIIKGRMAHTSMVVGKLEGTAYNDESGKVITKDPTPQNLPQPAKGSRVVDAPFRNHWKSALESFWVADPKTGVLEFEWQRFDIPVDNEVKFFEDYDKEFAKTSYAFDWDRFDKIEAEIQASALTEDQLKAYEKANSAERQVMKDANPTKTKGFEAQIERRNMLDTYFGALGGRSNCATACVVGLQSVQKAAGIENPVFKNRVTFTDPVYVLDQVKKQRAIDQVKGQIALNDSLDSMLTKNKKMRTLAKASAFTLVFGGLTSAIVAPIVVLGLNDDETVKDMSYYPGIVKDLYSDLNVMAILGSTYNPPQNAGFYTCLKEASNHFIENSSSIFETLTTITKSRQELLVNMLAQ